MKKSLQTLVATIVLSVAVSFFDAFALMFVWNKFVPAATGGLFPAINYWVTFGLMMLVDMFTFKASKAKDQNTTIPERIAYTAAKIAIEGILIGIAALVSLGI